MLDKEKEAELFPNKKTVYGPVKSWRLGLSLGIDPIFHTSTCSYNCIYCQLGQIQNITQEIKEYVPTQKVLEDFQEVMLKHPKIDAATYSGSGEPTLAKNIDQMIQGIRDLAPNVQQVILTNGTELHQKEVRQRLMGLDRIIFKLDASNERHFQLVNRPAPGVSFQNIVKAAKKVRQEFQGIFEIQSMFMPLNAKATEELATLFKAIQPDVIQLNTPKRPYPLSWHRENRGNHEKIYDYETRELKTVTPQEAQRIRETIQNITGIEVTSIYS